MNCQTFEKVINDLARDQMMDTGTRGQALAHGAECEVCKVRLDRERMLTVELQTLAGKTNSMKGSSRVEEGLVEAFRNRKGGQQSSKQMNRRGYFVAAIAALLLIVCGIIVVRVRLTAPSQNLSVVPQVAVMNAGLPSSVPVVAPGAVPSISKHKRVTAKVPRRINIQRPMNRVKPGSQGGVENSTVASVTPAPETMGDISEVTTEFMPLGYVNPLNLQDGGQLVRIEVSRSVMVSLGVPVNMDRYGERVKADVLVSADGLARAIRFVQ